MTRRSRSLLSFTGSLLLSLALGALAAGCAARVAVGYSTVAPPPPYVEVVGVAPGAGYVWAPGYWQWSGARYVWVPGSWVVPPAPGHVWVHSGWVADGGRYRFVQGRWVAPGRRPTVRYAHPPARVVVRPGAGYRTVRPAPRPARPGTVRVRP
ncbi:MAG: YXWGXW repeat-containing protein [Sandaracinaceae bacterium]|nr:YXWGXW repeat-containing protein [Sandaracinaceae bacterium]